MKMRTVLVGFFAITLPASSVFTACDRSPTSPTPRDGTVVEPPIVEPRAVVSGNYTLTIAAAEECGVGLGEGRLPQEARIRTYQAAVQQNGAHLEIRATSPTSRWGFFLGKVEGERVTFNLAWYDDSGDPEPSIVDRLSTSDWLAVRGHATTAGSPSRLAGTLRGDLRVFTTEWWRPTTTCTSENHQFVLSR